MTFRQFFRIVEIRTKVVSISTFSLAVLYSAWRTGAVRLWETLICFVAVFLVDWDDSFQQLFISVGA